MCLLSSSRGRSFDFRYRLKNRNHHLNVYFVLPVSSHFSKHVTCWKPRWDPVVSTKKPIMTGRLMRSKCPLVTTMSCKAVRLSWKIWCRDCVTGSVQDVREVRVFSIYTQVHTFVSARVASQNKQPSTMHVNPSMKVTWFPGMIIHRYMTMYILQSQYIRIYIYIYTNMTRWIRLSPCFLNFINIPAKNFVFSKIAKGVRLHQIRPKVVSIAVLYLPKRNR